MSNTKFDIKSRLEKRGIQMTEEEIQAYRSKVIQAILDLGGGEGDARFVRDEIIANGIINNRQPKDVAWALLQ